MYIQLLQILIGSFLSSAAIIFLLLKSPLSRFFADVPDHRKIHQQIVPRLGGLGLVLTFILIELSHRYIFGNRVPQLTPEWFSAFLFTSLFLLWAGTLDDVKPISFKMKFLLQFILASVIVGVFDIKFETIILFDHALSLGLFSYFFSVFWLVGIMNALNIIDGVDGLAACVSIAALVTLALLANAKSALGIMVLCIVLTGISAGFLVHNFAIKNKTFLGDTGSLFLGAMLGSLSIVIYGLPQSRFSFLVPLLVLGYPIFDTSVAMIRRYTRRISRSRQRMRRKFFNMFEADNEHMHHRLVHWGLTHLQTTFLLSLVAATMGSVAIIISRIEAIWQVIVIAYLITALLLILNRLNYLGLRHWVTFPRNQAPRPKLVGVIEPDEVFYYSLKTYEQEKMEFINIPQTMTNQFKNQFSALIVHNSEDHRFELVWNNALRASEVHECPVFVIASNSDINRINFSEKDFNSMILVRKPVRIPELIDTIDKKISRAYRSGHLMSDPQFGMEEEEGREIHA